MQDVPKFVRERLKVPSPVVNHPDADVLTAFSEHSLTDLERDTVLEHLARCGDCREIVALALPEPETVPIVLAPSRGWFAWPTLRWGLVAAGVIVVASFGVLQYKRITRPAMMASRSAAPELADSAAQKTEPLPEARSEQDKADTPSRVASAKVTERDELKKAPTMPAPLARADAPAAPTAVAIGGSVTRGALSYGPRMANQQQMNGMANQQQINSNSYPLPAQSPAPAAPPFAKQASSLDDKANTQSAQAVTVQNEVASNGRALQGLTPLQNAPMSQPSPTAGSAELSSVERAKPAESSVYFAAVSKVQEGSQGGAVGGVIASNPRWTINSVGALQRSFDQGTTWQDVNVNASNSPGAGGETLDLAKAAKVKAKDAEKVYKREMVGPTFRVVSADGSEVWAGGSAGMLYHSIDSGATWTRVIPAFSGVALTGDVIALDFPDPQHGRVSTSTSEVWSTADAGQTWQRQ